MPINDNQVGPITPFQGVLDFGEKTLLPPNPPALDVEEIVVTEREFDGNGNVIKETRTITRPRKLPKPAVDRPRLPEPTPLPTVPYTPWVPQPDTGLKPWDQYQRPYIQQPNIWYSGSTGGFFQGQDGSVCYNGHNWHQ